MKSDSYAEGLYPTAVVWQLLQGVKTDRLFMMAFSFTAMYPSRWMHWIHWGLVILLRQPFLLSLLDTEDIETSMEAGAQFAADTCMINGAFGCGIPFEDS